MVAAEARSGIHIDDGGVTLGKKFGARRLKALLLLSQHPELDELPWTGKVELHFYDNSVKGAVHQAAIEIAVP